MTKIKRSKQVEKEYTYEDRLRNDKKEQDEYEMKNYGVVTQRRDPSDAKYDQIIAVPAEIESPLGNRSIHKTRYFTHSRVKVPRLD